MIQKVFLWFYCLPIADAVLLILLATAVFLLLRRRCESAPYWKIAISMLLLPWLAVILFGTLGQRTEGGDLLAPVLTPFASYWAAFSGGSKEIYRSNFMNAVLFYPAGLVAGSLLRRKLWRLVGLFVIVSLSIELMQFAFCLGLAELDDVLHNTLGGCLGLLSAWQFERNTKKTDA